MEGTVLCLQPDDLCCPICVCTFSYPCSLPCGHSFCRQCIGTHWKTSTRISCPLCNKTLQNRPNLSKNTVLASIVERLQSQAEHCNSCMGPGATQLCLPCLAPLCPQHLPLHQNESTHHLLVNLPTVWPCRYHEHGLQFYCARHSATLCPNCVVQHKECPAVPLLQHYKSNQEKIQKTLSKIIQEIAVKEEELIMKRNAHWEYQIEVCDVTDKLIRDFQEMTDYLRRQRGALLGRIREGQETAQKEMVKSVTATQIEIDQLQRVKAQLEGKLSSDWMEVLKEPNCDTYQTSPTEHQDHQFNVNRIIEIAQLTDNIKQSLLAHPLLENAPSPLKQVTEVNTEPHNDSPTANDHPLPTHHLEETARDVVHFTEEMTEPHNDSLMENNHSLLPQRLEESVRDVQHWARDVSFDPQSVSCRLILSSDLKTVTVSQKNLKYPQNGRRFKPSQVMCYEGFSAGRNYWEINAKECSNWAVGVASAEIDPCDELGRNDLSWCVEWSKSILSAWHRMGKVTIHQPKPDIVGVFLDCVGKELSFFSVTEKTQTLIHSFQLHVQSRLFPVVWLYGLESGNSLTINEMGLIRQRMGKN